MISHRHKFIFIHIPKTGGTSYAYILHHYCEEITKHQFAVELFNECENPESYFKFTLVRNPWEREVSRYFYQRQNPLNKDHYDACLLPFKDWLLNRLTDKKHLQFYGAPMMDWITDKRGNVLVDFIARKEKMERDWIIICDKLKINGRLPWLNKSKHGHYSKYYDEESRVFIEKVYKKDIDFLGYEYIKQ